MGRYFAAYGRYDTALRHFGRMEKMAKDISLAEAEVIGAWSRGDIAEMRSEFGRAVANYLYAKGLAEIIGDSFWEAAALWRTAEVYRKLGQFNDAVVTAEDVRRRFASIGNMRMVAKADSVLAGCYLQMGLLNKASDLYNVSIDIFSKADDAPMERSLLIGLGFVDLAYEKQKSKPDYRKSLHNFMDLEVNFRRIDDPYLNVYKDLACAEALRLTDLTEGALTRFHDVIKTSNLYGFQLEKAHALLGVAATKLSRAEADQETANQAIKLYQKVGSTWGQLQALVTQALTERDIGASDTHLLHKATTIASNSSLYNEIQLIEKLATQKSAQKEKHVLFFIQAV